MRALWTYDLPSRGEDTPDGAQAPLRWDGNSVLLPDHRFEHDRETRGKDASKRGYRVDVHHVAPDGRGTVESFRARSTIVPQSWSFLQLGDELILHIGTFHCLPGGVHVAELPYVNACDGAGRGQFLQHDGLLVFADSRKPTVFCHDVETRVGRWTLDLAGKAQYRVAPMAIRDGRLVCFGRDALNYVNLATGTVEHQQTLPRVDRLYPPVEYEEDLLFPFTNWTSGGLLRFDPRRNKVKWKVAKRGRAEPPRGQPLPIVGRTAIFSINDGSSVVGVNVDSGEVRWTFRAQWLYTPIEIAGGSVIFGTAGGYGRHLRRHDIETGNTEWAVEMDGGCPYYDKQGDLLVAGDWSGRLRRIRAADGKVTEELALGGPLGGPPLVVGSRIYVLRWTTDGGTPSLVAVET